MSKLKFIDGGKRVKGDEKLSPLLSIITVVYNGEKYLEQTINSVISQNINNTNITFEYIIIDGGSRDSTIEIIEKYDEKIDYWLSESDEGIYHAMNKGIALAKGQFIGLINSDDYYLPNTFLNIYDYLLDKDCDVLYGDMDLIEASTSRIIQSRKPKSWKLYLDMNLSHPSTFISREVYSKHKYSLEYRIASDYDLLLKLKLSNKKFKYINETLSAMRNAGLSATDLTNTKIESKTVKKRNLGLLLYFISESYLLVRRLISKLSF